MMEELYAQLKIDFASGAASRQHYRTFLSSLSAHGLLGAVTRAGGSSRQDLVSLVNATLSCRESRLEGLCLLRHVLRQCSSDLLAENSAQWGPLLIRTIESEDNEVELSHACRVFSHFLRRIATLPEASRNFGVNVLPGFLASMLGARAKASEFRQNIVLEAFSACLQTFPGSCGPFRTKLEQHALTLLDSESSSTKEAAAVCLAFTARCGVSGGEGGRAASGTKNAEAWGQLTEKALTSLDSVLTQLYADLEPADQQRPQRSGHQPLMFAEVSVMEPARSKALLLQLDGLTLLLATLLEQDFLATVRLPVADILTWVCRALGVMPRLLAARPTPERQRLLASLPHIHRCALRVLESVVHAGGSGLVPHAETVARLLVQTLHAYESRAGVDARTCGGVRRAVYSAASVWVQGVGASCGLDASTLCADVLREILSDARPQRVGDELRLAARKDATSNSARCFGMKRKHDLSQDVTGPACGEGLQGGVQVGVQGDVQGSVGVCLAALQLLRVLLLCCGATLSTAHHRMVLDFCAPLLARIQTRSARPAPYDDARCRRALYEALKSATLCPALDAPPTLNLVARLFSAGLTDMDVDVKTCCREGLAVCHGIAHPLQGALVHRLTCDEESYRPGEGAQEIAMDDWRDCVAEDGDSGPVLNSKDKGPESNGDGGAVVSSNFTLETGQVLADSSSGAVDKMPTMVDAAVATVGEGHESDSKGNSIEGVGDCTGEVMMETDEGQIDKSSDGEGDVAPENNTSSSTINEVVATVSSVLEQGIKLFKETAEAKGAEAGTGPVNMRSVSERELEEMLQSFVSDED